MCLCSMVPCVNCELVQLVFFGSTTCRQPMPRVFAKTVHLISSSMTDHSLPHSSHNSQYTMHYDDNTQQKKKS
jgi:hypothetical protein